MNVKYRLKRGSATTWRPGFGMIRADQFYWGARFEALVPDLMERVEEPEEVVAPPAAVKVESLSAAVASIAKVKPRQKKENADAVSVDERRSVEAVDPPKDGSPAVED